VVVVQVVPSAEVVRYIRSHDEGHHLTTEVSTRTQAHMIQSQTYMQKSR
jgi:hypothetical protein